MLKVLVVASEGTPFSKTGGLADVVGSLPKALLDKGVDVRVVMPLYGTIPDSLRENIKHKKSMDVGLGWRSQYCGINECKIDGILYYFIDNEYYFKRDFIYGHHDEAERYGFFCRAVLEMLPEIIFYPDIIHCHDWQSGMVPVLLEAQYRNNVFYKDIKTLFTIHNLKYQGVFPKHLLYELFGLGDEYFTSDKLEFYGQMSFMKGGLVYSNLLTTVSPTYAVEIQGSDYGENFHGLLKARNHELSGILNGIDYGEFNPLSDKYIDAHYDMENLEGKVQNKLKLQRILDLEISPHIPVIGIISRLTGQKGIDLIAHVIDEIMKSGVQLIVLGTGDKEYENLFLSLKEPYKGRVSANITFDNTLAHRIYAGSDMFLMPSLFEPCGLGQIIALKYGTIPIVRETGGLKDTVMSYNEYNMTGNGFSFTNYNAHDMLYTIERALKFYKNKEVWNLIIKNSMSSDFGWEASALKYIELYEILKK